MNDYGYIFNRKNGRLGSSEPVDGEELEAMLGCGQNNDDNMFIFCSECGVYMDFSHGVKNELDGKWVCPECERKVRESTPYNQLERENEKFLSSFDDDDEDDDYDLYLKCHDD